MGIYSKDDFKKSMTLINDFFDKTIIPTLDTFDIFITVDRKGSIIFKEQSEIKMCIKTKPIITEDHIDANKDFLEKKSVLVFDDSIEDGATIRPIIDRLQQLNVGEITVAILISREDSLRQLQGEWGDIKFISAIVVKPGEFSITYGKSVWPYLDYICQPIQEDHPLLVIHFSESISVDMIKHFFLNYGEVLIDYSSVEFTGYSNRIKGHIELKNKISAGLAKDTNYSQLDEEIILKIRFYFRFDKNQDSTLTFQPILLESSTTDDPIEDIDLYLKKQIIKEVILEKFIFDYLEKIGGKISKFSVSYK